MTPEEILKKRITALNERYKSWNRLADLHYLLEAKHCLKLITPKTCKHCKNFFSRFACNKQQGECDCPKCQGFCKCRSI